MARGQTISRARERLDIVDQMLRQGYTRSSIQILLSKKWGMTRRQVRKYIAQVISAWEADAILNTENRITERRSQLEGVLEMALRQDPPNLKVAIAALDRLCKVDGCYPAQEVSLAVQQVGLGVGLGTLGFKSREEIRGRIDELKHRLLNGGSSTPLLGSNGKGNGVSGPH